MDGFPPWASHLLCWIDPKQRNPCCFEGNNTSAGYCYWSKITNPNTLPLLPWTHIFTSSLQRAGVEGALLCTLCLHHPHNNELHLTLAYNTYNIGKVVTRFYFPFILFWVALYNCYRAVLRGSVHSARHMTLWCTAAMHSWIYTILWQTRIALSAKIWHQRTVPQCIIKASEDWVAR